MRPFIRLLRRSSRARTESSFSGKSDMSTLHTHIVPQRSDYGSKLAVVVTHHTALVNIAGQSLVVSVTDVPFTIVFVYRL